MKCRFIARSRAWSAYPKLTRDCDTAAQYDARIDGDSQGSSRFASLMACRAGIAIWTTTGLVTLSRAHEVPAQHLIDGIVTAWQRRLVYLCASVK